MSFQSVIKKSCNQYWSYFWKIVDSNPDISNNKVIDRTIALRTVQDKLMDGLSFNTLYWGSPIATSLPSGERINYVLTIFREIQSKKQTLLR